MDTLPIDRTLCIYEAIADRSAIRGTRDRLSKYLEKMFYQGEHDPHRLTVQGLTYLQHLDRERDYRD